MELLFLGTSAGVPNKQRNVSALAVTLENQSGWYLIDCGEATQHQLLYTPLSSSNLNAIFITHIHGDHCYGLPGMLASAAMAGRKRPLTILAPAVLQHWFETTQRLTELYLPYALEWIALESLPSWQDDALTVETLALSHRVPSYAFCLQEKTPASRLDAEKLRSAGIPSGPLWGQLKAGKDIDHNGQHFCWQDFYCAPPSPRKMIVCGDNDQPELLRAACADAQLLVHEATYTEEIAEKVKESVQHSSAAAVARFAEAVGLPNLILTHFSGRYQSDPSRSPCIADLENEARSCYQGNLFLAEDFARYRLVREGCLQPLPSYSR